MLKVKNVVLLVVGCWLRRNCNHVVVPGVIESESGPCGRRPGKRLARTSKAGCHVGGTASKGRRQVPADRPNVEECQDANLRHP